MSTSSTRHIESIGADVIPRDVVAAVTQDRHGFLWVATGDGLVRHDGIEFRPQELDNPDPALRSAGWVRAMLPARDGRLWIGTESQGLAVHDPADGRLKLWPIRLEGDRADAAPRAPAQIQALAEDFDGALWAGYRGEGLVRIDPATGAGRAVPLAALPDPHVEALLVSRHGVLWVGTWGGLSRRLPGADHFETVPLGPGTGAGAQAVQALLEDTKGRLWVGTRDGALHQVVGDGGNLHVHRADERPARGPRAAVTSLAQTRDGVLWVGRSKGIDLHGPDGRWLGALQHQHEHVGGLAADEVTSLLVDRAGWVWIGGIGLGLQRHNPANGDIAVHGIATSPGGRPTEADVRSLLVRPDGRVWVSTLGDGVRVLDADLRVIRRVDWRAPTGQGTGVTPETVVAMAEGGGGSVWLATLSRLVLLDAAEQVRRSVAHTAGAIHALRVGADGALWVGAQGGLHRLGPQDDALVAVRRRDGEPLHGDIYVLAEAPDRSLWVGGLQGLLRVAAGEQVLQPVDAVGGQGLGGHVVIDLLFDAQGVLWVDTAIAGLHRMTGWDGLGARFDRVSQRLGIIGKPFGSNLLQDRRGRIWTHLHVHDPKADRVDALTSVDGARIGNGRFRVKGVLPDGRLLFGGTKGLMVVRAETWDRSTDRPPLVVTSLRINGQPRPTGPLPTLLRLDARERDIAVEFAALDLSEPRRLRYRHRLDGHDERWLESGADLRLASYGNLAPGDYTLRVQATNRSGVWSAQELAIRLRVEPAWWQTWGFRLLVALLVLAAASGVWQLRTRALRLRHDELEKLVRQRTTALEAVSRELQQRSAALEAASLVDPLTGLHNRRYLTEQIDALVAQAIRRHENHRLHGTPLGEDADLVFFLVDIDHFKDVNDHHGHAAGDAVLRQMRERLQQVFRAGDHLVRWGGEEFLVVAVGSSRHGAELLAERMRAAVADRPFRLDDGRTLHKTCSIGYACLPLSPVWPRALDWQQVLNVADAALYAAKTAGRNRWLGVVQADAPSAEALQARLRQPLEALEALESMEGRPADDTVTLTIRRQVPI